MRATGPGARWGRLSITTLPWVVSRIRVLSPAWLILSSFCVSPVYEGKDVGTSGHRIAEPFREGQRRAGADGGGRDALIERPGFRRRLARHEGEARLAQDFARLGEGQHDRHPHAGPRLLDRRQMRGPADAERQADVLERVQHRPGAGPRPAAPLPETCHTPPPAAQPPSR